MSFIIGTLYFANLEAGDSRHDGATYVCVVSNPILKSLMQGDDQIIRAVENLGNPIGCCVKMLRFSDFVSILILHKYEEQLRLKYFSALSTF